MPYAIEISGVTKTFGSKVAVNNLDLVIPTGSLCGFIGPNGAGKTTTIRMIMSILFPDRGKIAVLGKESALESKDCIGYLPEERGVYRKMRVGAFLTYMAKLKGIDAGAAKKKVRWWLERVELQDNFKKRCEELSKGMQQKVQFIAAVIHEPDLLILDEVFSGLDPVNRKLMRQLIHEHHTGTAGTCSTPSASRASGRTIIFSTHAMYEAEQLCNRIFMIHRGNKMLDATPREIHRRYDAREVIVELMGDPAGAALDGAPREALARIPGVVEVRPEKDGLHLAIRDARVGQDVLAAAVMAMRPFGGVQRAELKRVSLEEVFIHVVEATGQHLVSSELEGMTTQAAAESAAQGEVEQGGENGRAGAEHGMESGAEGQPGDERDGTGEGHR